MGCSKSKYPTGKHIFSFLGVLYFFFYFQPELRPVSWTDMVNGVSFSTVITSRFVQTGSDVCQI